MSKRVRVMIAGAGGINSWFVELIADQIKKEQIPLFWEFTIFDGDAVEKKNLLYQNFDFKDQLENKAEILGKRFGILHKPKYVKKATEFDNFDLVVCGVDNREFRAMLYEYMNDNPDKQWIDMRAEGRVVAVFAKNPKNTLAVLMKSLPEQSADQGGSCQLDYELSAGIVQLGNRIVANIGAQYLLNIVRGEMNPPSFIHRF
jgi:molybdopterin/thiamine biosynthesis adenylyltransferase